MSSKNRNNNKNGLERREFLKMSATGIAVYLSGCTPDILIPRPVDSVDIIDPEFARAANWQEPWTWRPELWPDAQLNLNVVRSQNPGLSPSPGNPAPMLFSYNGSSPGPSIRVRSDGILQVKVRNNLG